MRKRKILILSITIVAIALILETCILKYVNDKNAQTTSNVLLDRVIAVIDKNESSESEFVKSLKDDYIVRAKAISYIVDAKPEVEYDVDELQKIAGLMLLMKFILLMIRERSFRVRYLNILDIVLIQVNKWLSLNKC